MTCLRVLAVLMGGSSFHSRSKGFSNDCHQLIATPQLCGAREKVAWHSQQSACSRKEKIFSLVATILASSARPSVEHPQLSWLEPGGAQHLVQLCYLYCFHPQKWEFQAGTETSDRHQAKPCWVSSHFIPVQWVTTLSGRGEQSGAVEWSKQLKGFWTLFTPYLDTACRKQAPVTKHDLECSLWDSWFLWATPAIISRCVWMGTFYTTSPPPSRKECGTTAWSFDKPEFHFKRT